MATQPADVRLGSNIDLRDKMVDHAHALAPSLVAVSRLLHVFSDDACWPELQELVEATREQLDATIALARKVDRETHRILI